MQFEDCVLKTNVLALASQSNAEAKPRRRILHAHLQELYLSVKDLGLRLSQKLIRLSLTQCQNN